MGSATCRIQTQPSCTSTLHPTGCPRTWMASRTQLSPTSQSQQWAAVDSLWKQAGPWQKGQSRALLSRRWRTQSHWQLLGAVRLFWSPGARDVPSFQRWNPSLLLSCPLHYPFFLFPSPCPCQLPLTIDNQNHSSLFFLGCEVDDYFSFPLQNPFS